VPQTLNRPFVSTRSWDPLAFLPPIHILKYDSIPKIHRLVDSRGIAKRVSILVHSDFFDLATRRLFHPFYKDVLPSKPFKTRLQPFSSSGRENSMFRVV